MTTPSLLGYVLVPPSPANCHKMNRPYTYIPSLELDRVQTISAAERSLILDTARAFDATPASSKAPTRVANSRSKQPPDLSKPGNDFNARTQWDELLRQYGWTFIFESDGVQQWRRPGKYTGSVSATVNYGGSDRLFIFSSNAHPLEQERSYSKFEFLATVKYGGDFSKTAKVLLQSGYGKRKPHRSAQHKNAPIRRNRNRNRYSTR